MFHQKYSGRRVLVTGHTGFKGSWLTYWLQRLDAEVCGVALPMPTSHSQPPRSQDVIRHASIPHEVRDAQPNHFDLLRSRKMLDMRSEMVDIRDGEKLGKIFQDFRPEVVFHLAAQPLVRYAYTHPVETFETNVIGTANVLEAIRQSNTVLAAVVVSSDKCYENREWLWGYRETEAMGGYDPYSASKGCTELVTASYRRSFFPVSDYGTKHQTLLASGRAGNVIGGGDWAQDRLVPDMMRAAVADREVIIRSPRATRPWQHVLEPLSGYLLLGQKLLEGRTECADGWNFGPSDDGIITVESVSRALAKHWDRIRVRICPPTDAPHEATLLRLDCSKARSELGWHGVWTPEETFRYTAQWYKSFAQDGVLRTESDLDAYLAAARQRGLEWSCDDIVTI